MANHREMRQVDLESAGPLQPRHLKIPRCTTPPVAGAMQDFKTFQIVTRFYKHKSVTDFFGRLRNAVSKSKLLCHGTLEPEPCVSHYIPTTSCHKFHPQKLPMPPQRNDTASPVLAVADRTNSGAGPLPPWGCCIESIDN